MWGNVLPEVFEYRGDPTCNLSFIPLQSLLGSSFITIRDWRTSSYHGVPCIFHPFAKSVNKVSEPQVTGGHGVPPENDLRLLRLISFHLFKFGLAEVELSKYFLLFSAIAKNGDLLLKGLDKG